MDIFHEGFQKITIKSTSKITNGQRLLEAAALPPGAFLGPQNEINGKKKKREKREERKREKEEIR